MPTIKDQISREEFLSAIESIKLRVEKQPTDVNNLETFVPVINFETLFTPNTQIVYGRNGTGKTHLFKAFYQYCDSNFERTKVLPIFIDFRTLELGPVLPRISLDDLILRFYRLFFREVLDSLRKFSDRVITVPLLEKLFRGESKARKRAIYKSIGKINAILNLEQIEERVKKYVRKVEKEKKGSTEIGGGIRISGGISTSGAEAGVGGGLALSAEETKRQQETVELIYNGLAVIDYEAAKGELENIIEQCGAKGIILLVDEWSSVSMSLQPLLAEMIRKTIASSSKVFLKMGSLKYFTRTSAIIDGPQRIGFQSGIDITPVADLDQLLNFDIDRQRVKDFLTIVIYKHACQELPALKEYTVKQFEDYLCGELFQNQNAYFEVIRSSEGNPRDFLTILAGCCTGGRRHQKISQEDAIGAAVIHFTDAKAPEIKGNAEANELSNRIFQRVVKNKQKLFLCSVDKAESDHRIQELWHYRFFHIVNPIFTVIDDDGIPHDYIVYSMDYGKLLSLKVGEAGQKVLDLMQLVLDTTTRIGFRSGVSRILTTFLDSEELGGPLKKLAGKTAAQRKGVEPADISNPGFLVEKCVIDDLL